MHYDDRIERRWRCVVMRCSPVLDYCTLRKTVSKERARSRIAVDSHLIYDLSVLKRKSVKRHTQLVCVCLLSSAVDLRYVDES